MVGGNPANDLNIPLQFMRHLDASVLCWEPPQLESSQAYFRATVRVF